MLKAEIKEIKMRKKDYPKGTRIVLLQEMNNDPRPLLVGTQGTVSYVDDFGTLHTHWDNKRYLGACLEDKISKLPGTITIQKYTEEDVCRSMSKKGYDLDDPMYWSEVTQYFRECYGCSYYVSVDDVSENMCDQCSH